MANQIQIKRSSVAGKVPVAADLAVGELAVNLTDKKIFSKDASNNIIELAAGGGGGASYEVGEVMLATSAPTTGTWLETGKYYSKSAYPALAAKIGNVADFGTPVSVPQAQLPQPFVASSNRYLTATNGTVTVVVGNGGAIRRTTNGVNWVGVPSQTTSQLNEVCFLNSNFVAVGTGAIVTSSDGTNWVARATSASNMLSVAFGNGRYVAVGGSGAIQYSSDLATWTLASGTGTTQFNKVIYANSLFVAVGNNGACYTSPDGVTWTARSAGSGSLNDLVYANSLFVAVGNSGACYTSSDGVTWTSRSITGTYVQVIYENSLFVAVGTSGSISTSTDGTTWTTRQSNTTNVLNSVAWNGANYVAVGASGTYCTSPDGVTWTGNSDVSFSTFNSVAVVGGKTIAFGASSSVILAGATRTEVLQSGTWAYTVAAQSAINPRTIAYNGTNQYVAVGSNGAILSSSDGQSWTARYSGVTTSFDKVQYVNGNYIAMGGSGSANLLTSGDGITWTKRNAGTAAFSAAAFGNGVYVVVGASGIVFSSPDLVTWTSRSAGTNQFNDIVFANSLFVAVGSGVAYTSPDGITWTLATGFAGKEWYRIIYANSLFVAVGSAAGILTSSDGVTWTPRTATGYGSSFIDVTWNGSLFCAVGQGGGVFTSPDGVTWTARTPGDTTVNLNSISWSGTRFVVTNTTNAGNVWTSTDGITWSRTSSACPTNITSALYTAYLGGKFLSIGSGFIQTSSDGINWTNADQVQYVPTSINKLYKLGGFYYALTSAGLFQSADGVTFAIASRSIRMGAILSMAYSGSSWIIVSAAVSGQPQVFYKSTDGTTWAKSADIGTLTNTNTIAGAVIDLVYANGNFISGQIATLAQNIPFTIYTSPDGVTWTGRQTPYLSTPATTIASDGTTAVFGSSSGTFKSTDGGLTWTQLTATAPTPVIYSNGVWVFSSINNHTVSPDLSNFYFTGITAAAQVPSSVYVSGNNIAGISAQSKLYFNKSASGYVAVPSVGNPSITYIATQKEIPSRSATALMAVQWSNPTVPNLILEAPLYSYDTSTTFWIPPSNAGVGQQAYIYAGA